MSERASCANRGPSLSPSTIIFAGLKFFAKDNLCAGNTNCAGITFVTEFAGCVAEAVEGWRFAVGKDMLTVGFQLEITA